MARKSKRGKPVWTFGSHGHGKGKCEKRGVDVNTQISGFGNWEGGGATPEMDSQGEQPGVRVVGSTWGILGA